MPKNYKPEDVIYPDLDDEAVQAENARLVEEGKATWAPELKGGIRLIKQDPYEGWRKIFLNTIRQKGVIREGCREAKISRSQILRTMDREPEFKRAFDLAKQDFIDKLEKAAFDRALAGSETLLKFTLTANRSDVYNQAVRSEVKVDQTVYKTGPAEYTSDQLSEIFSILQQAGAIREPTGSDEEDPDSQT